MDHDDYLQEAYCTFLRCATRYPMLDTPQHFMSLFKRSWTNRVHDLARSSSSAGLEVRPGLNEDGEEIAFAEPVGELENAGFLAVLVRQAPDEVRAVLALLINAPAEILDLALNSLRGTSDSGLNRWLNARIGMASNHDTVGAVRRHFTGEEES